MNKCHTPINWQNNTTPAINDTNLNYMDGCIDTIDDRVVSLANDPPENALKAEGWAVGTQNGTAVTSDSPYYHNNSKYWKDQAQAIASNTLSGLSDVGIANPQNGQVLSYHSATQTWVNDNNTVDISGKADKVSGATNGHFAGLDSNGNLTDSGKSSTDFATASHSQAASTINAGTLAGKVLANATAVTTLSDKQVRNITASTTDLTAGTSALTTGDIYLVYE